MSNAGGRPLEAFDLPKDWQIEVLDLYKQGGSDVEVKAMIYKMRGSFSNNLWERWMTDEPEFWETIKTGKLLSEAWWHQNGRTNLWSKEFNYTGWYMQMKNRFGWSDKQEIDHTTKGDKIETTAIMFSKGQNG